MSTGSDFEQKKILVVDDVQDNRILIKAFLSPIAVKVDLACDGREAIKKALTGDYSLILMDIQMPVIDGIAATKKLREENFHTPIIALTAFAMLGDKEKLLAQGFDGYLGKPIDRDALFETVNKYTQRV